MAKRLIRIILCISLVASLSISPAFAAAKTTTMNATINSNMKITFNGQNLSLEDAEKKPLQPIIYSGNTYIPLRAFANTIGLQFFYDSKTNTVNLDNKYSLIDLKAMLTDQNLFFNNNAVIVEKISGGNSIKIDTKKLPANMKGFSKISVSGILNNNINDITQAIVSSCYLYKSMIKYDESVGFRSGNSRDWELVLLYDDTEKLIGYSVFSLSGKTLNENNNKQSNIKVYENNINININEAKFQPKDGKKTLIPITYNGNTYVPLKQLAESIGLRITTNANSVALTKQSNLKDIKEYTLSLNKSLLSIDDAISFKLRGRSITIKVDRDKLPDSLKNFEKITTSELSSNSTDIIGATLLERLLIKFNLNKYNNETGYLTPVSNQYLAVMILDGNDNILGYSIIDVYSTIDKTPINITVTPADATPKEKLKFPSFKGAITLSGDVPRAYWLKIDRSKLPDSMKNFTRFSYTLSDNNSAIITSDILNSHHPIIDYNESTGNEVHNVYKGFSCLYNTIILYDNNDNKLGYCVIQVE